jgi:hypothetical protein
MVEIMTNQSNPYFIEAPALISFSGGRTSGYMLKQIIDAYGGTLPANVIPCFANTGKEMPQTLEFVRVGVEVGGLRQSDLMMMPVRGHPFRLLHARTAPLAVGLDRQKEVIATHPDTDKRGRAREMN